MLCIISFLDFSSTIGFIDTPSHRIRDVIGIHDDFAIRVSSRTSRYLDKGGFRTKEALVPF